MLAPSIYDRKYTQMVGQRYLQQITLDTSEAINKIAADNPFEPEDFRILAEAYVSKVTELAPDYLKADVNHTAQVKMVEHFNHIIRVRAERDHTEAKGMQIQTIDDLMDDVVGYVSGGAPAEIIGAAVLKAKAAVEQGDALHFWLDDEKRERMEAIDRQYAVATISRLVTTLPQGDPVAAKELALALNNFANGVGDFPMVNAAGEIVHIPLEDMPISQIERIAISEFALGILQKQEEAFGNLQDARLTRDWEDFQNWYIPHQFDVLTNPTVGLDMERLQREFRSADFNVQTKGYQDTLRNYILDEMQKAVTGGGKPTAFQKAFDPGFIEWVNQMNAEQARTRQGRPREDFTPEELRDQWQAARQVVGNIPGGYREQTKAGAQEVTPYYTSLTGVNMDRQFYSDLINNPDDPRWADLETLVPSRMSLIGIWDDPLRDTLIGRLTNTEGMNQESLEGTMKLARLFWEQPTFKRNIRDSSALGEDLGGALNSIFNRTGNIQVADFQKRLENFTDPNYSPAVKIGPLVLLSHELHFWLLLRA